MPATICRRPFAAQDVMAENASVTHGLSARGGLHAVGTRLRLHPGARSGVAWMAALGPLPTGLARGLCAADLAALLPPLRHRPFAVPWGKPFQLGRLTLAVLPAGAGPGSSLLRLHLGGKTLLVATAARPDALPLGPSIEPREADALVVDAAALQRVHTPLANLDRLIDAAADHVAHGQSVDFFVDDAAVALQAVARWRSDPARLRATAALRALCARARLAGWPVPVPQPAVQTALPNCTVRERTRATAQLARTPGALAFFLHGDAPAPTAACSAPFHVTGGGSALQDWIRLLEVAHLIVVASAHRDDTPVGAAPMPWAGLAPRVTVLNARAQLDLW